jgi:hypothetical protein
MAQQIGHGGDVAYDIGGALTSTVDESKPFYGVICTAAGTVVLKGDSGTTVDIGSLAVGDMIAGLHLIGYTGGATLQKLT